MNLEGKIDLIKNAVTAIKNAILGKGITPSGNLSTYADAIGEITTPNNQTLSTITSNGTYRYDNSTYTGFDDFTVNVQPNLDTKTITANGVYNASSDNVDGYSSVIVDVPIAKLNYIVRNGNEEVIRGVNNSFLDISTKKINANDAFTMQGYQEYINDRTITSIKIPNLKEISKSDIFNGAFQDCTNLISIDFSELEKTTGAFYGTFGGCTNLISVNFNNLKIISDDYAWESIFEGCTNLTSISLDSLNDLRGMLAFYKAFKDTGLTTLSFNGLTSNFYHGGNTDQFYDMLSGVTGCTVHFPSNLQSVIGSWSDVQAGFGGTNTTVLFDLPATT